MKLFFSQGFVIEQSNVICKETTLT